MMAVQTRPVSTSRRHRQRRRWMEASLGSKGVDQFGHVERVSAGARDEQRRPGPGGSPSRSSTRSATVCSSSGPSVTWSAPSRSEESTNGCSASSWGPAEGHDERHGHIAEVAMAKRRAVTVDGSAH